MPIPWLALSLLCVKTETMTHLGWHVVESLGKGGLEPVSSLGDRMLGTIEPGRVPPDLPHIACTLSNTLVFTFALIPFVHLALILRWTSGITDDKFCLDRTEVHGVGDELGVMRNTK